MIKNRAPKYCHGFIDRHGKPRWYFRQSGRPRVALPGLPWSPEFMAAYEAAMRGHREPPRKARTKAGSLDALIASYYHSAAFIGLSASTKTTYRGIIERLRVEHGDKPAAGLKSSHIRAMLDARATTPSAANNLLNILRILLAHAVEMGFREDNPALTVKPLRVKSSGFHSWSDHEIAQFETRWPVGARERLALGLLLYTGQRRSDVVQMGPQHIRDSVLSLRQQKTGSLVEIPVHPELTAIIEASRIGHLAFLVTTHGQPFTAAGFGNWFREVVRSAGLPDACSAHGLRKAACRRLAEAGCTAHEIMSISGHRHLQEVTGYTEAADRARLAQSAMRRFGTYREQTTGKPGEEVATTGEKSSENNV